MTSETNNKNKDSLSSVVLVEVLGQLESNSLIVLFDLLGCESVGLARDLIQVLIHYISNRVWEINFLKCLVMFNFYVQTYFDFLLLFFNIVFYALEIIQKFIDVGLSI